MVFDHLFYAHLYKDLLPHASMSRQACEEHYESVGKALGCITGPSEITKALLQSRGFDAQEFWRRHPALFRSLTAAQAETAATRADFVAFYHWVVFGGEEAARGGEPAAVEDRSFGFVLLRHVNSCDTNLYWQLSYVSIRRHHPDARIVIIDDNSDEAFLQSNLVLHHTEIIRSAWPGRGELLPYIYYLERRWFDTAVILHDSTFLQRPMKVDDVHEYSFLWTFEHTWDKPALERSHMARLRNSAEALAFYGETSAWKGCFGAMSVVGCEYLQKVDRHSDLRRLLDVIRTRIDRMAFERIIACLLEMHRGRNKAAACSRTPSLFGDIHRFGRWGKSFDELSASDLKKPIIKVWTGR
jgi:hypothetical protein